MSDQNPLKGSWVRRSSTIWKRKGENEIGVATAIAWTENGGEIMPVEVAILEGKGGVQMTGQMGDVMQESGQAALTYIKSRASQLKIDLDIFSSRVPNAIRPPHIWARCRYD